MEIDSWSVPLPEIQISQEGSSFYMDKLRPNIQWDVIDYWTYVMNTTNELGSEFNTFSFVFKLRRTPIFVLLNRLLPCCIMILLELMIFMIPPDAGEKLSLGITLLLAQTVFQLVIEGDMPKTSDQIPLISKAFASINKHLLIRCKCKSCFTA